MKQFVFGVVATVAVTSVWLRSKRREEERLFDEYFIEVEDGAEQAERPGHKFEIGDPVIIIDPIDPYGAHYAKRGVVDERKQEEHGYIDVYRVKGDTNWFNENWLTADILGPKVLRPMPELAMTAPNNSVELDYWLATLSDSKRVGDNKGVAEAEAELRRLITEEVSD